MSAYGLNIDQIMGWTFPQLLLLNRRRKQRERDTRRFQLMLVAGSLAPQMFDYLWQGLGGEPIDLDEVESEAPSTPAPSSAEFQVHGVDEKGNVTSRGAPLLSDIALGKATAPLSVPITKIDRSEDKEKPNG